MSTTWRTLLGFLLLLAAAFYSFETRLLKRVERQYLEAAEESMVDAAQLLASVIEQELAPDGTIRVDNLAAAFAAAHRREFSASVYNLTKTAISTNAYVTDSHGVVLFDSNGSITPGTNYLARRDVALTLAGKYGARSTRIDEADDRSSVMFVAAPIRFGSQTVGVVSVSKPQGSMFQFVDETDGWIRRVGLLFFMAVTIGALLVATLFSYPIRRLTRYARAVARGERAVAPQLDAPELKTLGRAFEEMRDALENRKYVESYVQTLTHEMKSPVAAIRGAAELLREAMPIQRRDKFIANIQAEARRLQNIIDRLLALSAIESRKSIERPKPVALAELAQTVCLQLEAAAEARELKVELLTVNRPIVRGEPFLLEIALTNLLQNAMEFSPSGATISVRIGPDEGSFARISVEDRGPGIPDYALPRVFERFYSLQHPLTGHKSSGLGLCFVREAMALHGGSAAIANRTDGPGVVAVLLLPLG